MSHSNPTNPDPAAQSDPPFAGWVGYLAPPVLPSTFLPPHDAEGEALEAREVRWLPARTLLRGDLVVIGDAEVGRVVSDVARLGADGGQVRLSFLAGDSAVLDADEAVRLDHP